MNFDDIVKPSPGLCRCCLSEGCYKDLGTEYSWMNDTEVYADMLLDCFDIGITQHNDGPNGPKRLICEVCITRLRDACNFKKQVLDSEKKFIDMLGRGEFKSKVLSYQPEMKAESIEVPIEEPYLTDVEYLEDNIEYEDSEEVIKTEEPSTSQPTTSDREARPKRGRPKKPDAKPEKSPKPAKIAKVAKDYIEVDMTGLRSGLSTNQQIKLNIEILFNNTTIVPFKYRGKHQCFFCGKQSSDRDQLILHHSTHLPCSTKDNSFKEVKQCKLAELKVDVSELNCKICSEEFETLEDIAFHLKKKHKLPFNISLPLDITMFRLKDFKCLKCNKVHFDYFGLLRHMNTDHQRTDNYECDICGRQYNWKKSLRDHIFRNHMEHYQCKACEETFDSLRELSKHKMKIHCSQCILCLKLFPTCNVMIEHIKTEHNVNNERICQICQKYYTNISDLLNHAVECNSSQRTRKANEINRMDEVRSLREKVTFIINNSSAMPFKYFCHKFRCFYCTENFDKCDDLKVHTSEQHQICDVEAKYMKMKHRARGTKIKIDTSSLSCKICSEPADCFDNLVAHFASDHEVALHDCVEQFMPYKLLHDHYPCPLCREEFRYFNALLSHVNTDHSGNKFICVHCGKPFRTDPSLRSHIVRNHPKSLAYKCTKCDFSTFTNSILKEHMGNSHGAKIVKCPLCDEFFQSRYAKNVHNIKVHGGGHKCQLCGKAFTKYSHVVNHVRKNHLKEKNVSCTLCDKRFFDTSRLTRHMLVHGTRERNYQCEHCDRSFLRKSNLNDHLKCHRKSNDRAASRT